jgi:hypothetical protein
MTKAAKDAGHIKIGDVEFPQDKIQILTVEDLFRNHNCLLVQITQHLKKHNATKAKA